jgi:Flp pilus assembly protein TadG
VLTIRKKNNRRYITVKFSTSTFLHRAESEKGQVLLAYIILFPVFIIALFVVTDLGRYFYLKNQVRIAADSAALAAAGALDISEAGAGNYIINERWALDRATKAIKQMSGAIAEDNWMTYSVAAVIVDGRDVTVIVNGNGSSLFGGYLGISGFNAQAVSHARAAVGVDSEW